MGEIINARIKPIIIVKTKIIFSQKLLVLAKLKKVLGLNIPNIKENFYYMFDDIRSLPN
jgi:hypothetical protein